MLLYPRVMEGNGSSTPILSLFRSRSEAVHRLCRSGTVAEKDRLRSEIGVLLLLRKKIDYGFGNRRTIWADDGMGWYVSKFLCRGTTRTCAP